MSHIYTVTAMTFDGKDHRCFGFYFTLDKAKIAAIMNHGDMQEHLYEYLVIESIMQGTHAHAIQVEWFKWDGRDWIACRRKPEFANGVSNWSGIG